MIVDSLLTHIHYIKNPCTILVVLAFDAPASSIDMWIQIDWVTMYYLTVF